MDKQRPNQRYGHEEEAAEELGQDVPADASEMTEGVGGMPDLEPEERATVSDVDGDNVDGDPVVR